MEQKKQKGWDSIIKKAVVHHRRDHPDYWKESPEESKKKNNYFAKIVSTLLKMIPIPIILGGIAAYYYYIDFGGEMLKKTLLEWTMGITLIATIIPLLLSLLEGQKSKIEQKINKGRKK